MRIPPLVQVAAAALPLLGQPFQAQAQAPSQQGGTVRVGTLRCDVAGTTAFVFGSTRAITCDFVNVNGRRERYTGEISRYGVDLGFTQAAVMLWAVLAPTTDLQPGVLAGTFVGGPAPRRSASGWARTCWSAAATARSRCSRSASRATRA